MHIPAPYEYRQGTSGHAVGLPFDSQQLEVFPKVIEWTGITLQKKDEFHATLLHVKTATALASVDEERILSFFAEFVDTEPIRFVSFIDDFRYVEQNEKKTIVVRCRISNLNELFAALNKKFDIEMPTQPPHVTLYTLQKNIGIHIPSVETMERLERVQLPELEQGLKTMKI